MSKLEIGDPKFPKVVWDFGRRKGYLEGDYLIVQDDDQRELY